MYLFQVWFLLLIQVKASGHTRGCQMSMEYPKGCCLDAAINLNRTRVSYALSSSLPLLLAPVTMLSQKGETAKPAENAAALTLSITPCDNDHPRVAVDISADGVCQFQRLAGPSQRFIDVRLRLPG